MIRKVVRALARQLRQRPGEPTLAEVIRSAISSRLGDVHTATPGIVQSYDSAKQVADIQPAVLGVVWTEDGDLVTEQRPVIPNVPVAWFRGAGASLQFKLAKGDTGFLVFSADAMGLWRASGAISEPGDLTRHDISYPIFLPCCAPDANALDAVGASEGAVLDTAGADIIRLGGAGASFVAIASKVLVALDAAIAAGIAGAVAGDGGHAALTALKSTLDAGTVAALAATKLKGE